MTRSAEDRAPVAVLREPVAVERNTHLLDWLEQGYTHCQYGSEDWCNAYLLNAAAVIKSQDAELARLLDAQAAEIAELKRRLEEAQALVTEANNSLYGSQGYFHSLNGGPFDKYHLASGIETVKESSRKEWRRAEAAESRATALSAELEIRRTSEQYAQRCCEKANAFNAELSAEVERLRKERDLRRARTRLEGSK